MSRVLINLSLFSLGVFVFTGLPISMTVIINLSIACASALSSVSSYTLNNTIIGYGTLLSLSAAIFLCGLVSALFFSYQQSRDSLFYVNIFGVGLATSGVAACGFLLNTLNQIREQQHFTDAFPLIMKHDPAKIQTLLASEPTLVAWVVICSVAVIGLIALAIYRLNHQDSLIYS